MWRRCGRAEAPSGRSWRTVLQNCPSVCSDRADPGNGRTLRSAIEEKWMVKLDPENALWTWLVEDAGWLVNREEVGHDGWTPHER